jgi:hypothetical protein
VGDAKRIDVKPISRADADRLVTRVHYSRKPYTKAQVHLGVFLDGRLHGAIQFGDPIDRRRVLPLVRGTEWSQMTELNRMAFDDALPRNSESRALAVAFRWMRKSAPHLKWVLSFSDATRCGDGAIYRASGFVLTGMKENRNLYLMPDGEVVSNVGLNTGGTVQRRYGFVPGRDKASDLLRAIGARPIPGYQFRYVRFLDPEWRDRLTVPVIPFDKIPDHARMYRGTRRPVGGTGDHPDAGGAGPTPALHTDEDGGR